MSGRGLGMRIRIIGELVRRPWKMAAAASLVLAAATLMGSPSVYPTGVTIYDPARAYNCYVAFSASDGNTYLIDMDGNVVHQWPYRGNPSAIINPKLVGGARGHVLVQYQTLNDPRGGIFTDRTVAELDWNGNKVWEWGEQAPGGAARQNHDWARLKNGNTLLLVTLPRAVPGLGPKVIGDQAIYEVTPAGKIVWKWVAGDHLSEFGFSPAGMAYLRERVRRNPPAPYGYLEINDMQVLGPNRWFDAGDRRFNPQNIMIDARKGNVILIISKKTGHVVWRLGPVFPGSEYSPDQRILKSKVPRPVDQFSGQHNAHLIPEGLPGAGNLLLLDNEGGAGFPPAALGIYPGSRVLEIDPEKKEIVWQYTGQNSGQPPWAFFTAFVGNVARLPNGNTLIDEGMNGRVFQITRSGEIVWEYVTPFVGWLSSLGGKKYKTNLIYRAQPVPYDWVPAGTPHAERPVKELDVTKFRVPMQ